ncbi:MAG: ABC transporter substrate-binding protein [bacterium]|nr:ABC transporter substrate-binding protein [bacterium]
MRTRYGCLTLMVVLAVTAASCGGTEEPATAAPSTTAAAVTTVVSDDGAGVDEGDDAQPARTTIATDAGVDLEAGVIRVGMLADLTGAFGPLASLIAAGAGVYWADVNAKGGVHGLQVELIYRDTVYSVDNHVQFYEELKDQVVAFGHSTGSPHTVAIREDLEADGILAVPFTWYSGWSDPALNANLMSHGTPYCIEAMNLIGYLSDLAKSTGIANPTLAIAGFPGDYGLDSAAGALLAAEALGMEVVHDASGKVIPGQDNAPIGNAIAQSGADIVWVTANAGAFAEIYGSAVAQGFEALWSGAAPTWSPALVAPDSPIKDAIDRDYYVSSYFPPLTDDTPGMAAVRALVDQYAPDTPRNDYLIEGFIEGMILFEALKRAYSSGDMTQAGVVAAAKSIEELDFGGIAPNESYVGSANDRLQRKVWISRPDPEGLAAGTTGTGTRLTDPAYTHPVAAAFVFEEACYKLA